MQRYSGSCGLFVVGAALVAAGLWASASHTVQAAPAQNGFAKLDVRQAVLIEPGTWSFAESPSHTALVAEDFVPRSRNQPGGPLFGVQLSTAPSGLGSPAGFQASDGSGGPPRPLRELV